MYRVFLGANALQWFCAAWLNAVIDKKFNPLRGTYGDGLLSDSNFMVGSWIMVAVGLVWVVGLVLGKKHRISLVLVGVSTVLSGILMPFGILAWVDLIIDSSPEPSSFSE